MASSAIFFMSLLLIWAVVSTFLSRKAFKSRAFYLFRALFPSWRFFDEIERSLKLSARWKLKDGNFSHWEDVIPVPKRNWGNLFLNPRGQIIFLSHTLVQQLMEDVGDSDGDANKTQNSVSYELIRRLVHSVLQDRNYIAKGAGSYQFKISFESIDACRASEDALLSPVLEA